jgi:hypothetical protein
MTASGGAAHGVHTAFEKERNTAQRSARTRGTYVVLAELVGAKEVLGEVEGHNLNFGQIVVVIVVGVVFLRFRLNLLLCLLGLWRRRGRRRRSWLFLRLL